MAVNYSVANMLKIPSQLQLSGCKYESWRSRLSWSAVNSFLIAVLYLKPLWKWNCYGLRKKKNYVAFFCGKWWFIDDSCSGLAARGLPGSRVVVFLCDAVMPLISRHCLNLIHKKDKGINNECFVVIPLINIACVCVCIYVSVCVWLLVFINRSVSLRPK